MALFGPLVTFGLALPPCLESTTDALAGHTARLTPLTDTDADNLIGSVRPTPLCSGTMARPSSASRHCAICCCGYCGSPAICPRSPTSTSRRSSPGPTGWSSSALGSGGAGTCRKTRSCASCAEASRP